MLINHPVQHSKLIPQVLGTPVFSPPTQTYFSTTLSFAELLSGKVFSCAEIIGSLLSGRNYT